MSHSARAAEMEIKVISDETPYQRQAKPHLLKSKVELSVKAGLERIAVWNPPSSRSMALLFSDSLRRPHPRQGQMSAPRLQASQWPGCDVWLCSQRLVTNPDF
jgi:hypothetical protein